VREFDAAETDEERTNIINQKLDEIRAIDPAIEKVLEDTTFEIDLEAEITAPAPQPALSPSRMLEGLSKIGERVRDAAQRAMENVVRVFDDVSDNPPQVTLPDTSLSQPLPEPEAPTPEKPEPAPTPSPTPQPSPQPAPQPTQPSQASRPNSFLQGGLGILSALLGTVLNFFNDDGTSSQPSQPSQPVQSNAAASIAANPSTINDGDTTRLSWTSVGTLSCVVVDSTLNVIKRGGTAGDLTSAALSESTRFGVICDIEAGKDKFVNETLVRVTGDESEPKRLFAQSGRASTAAPASGSSSGGTSDGSTGSGASGQNPPPQPVDVRTCDPEQSLESFTRCLCEAEPNPNGCSLVQ
jgi:outer membrane biosynthesis protein TonB